MTRYWLGKTRSEEDRKKMSETAKKTGKIPPSRKGLKNSYESNEKRRLKLIGKKRPLDVVMKGAVKRRGKNHWNWKGGVEPENKKIRKSIEYRLWRESVFARDNWTCQKYGIRGVKLHPHHIQNFSQYPELRFAIDNGITLSIKAHTEFHKIYGKKNNNLEQLKEFIEKEQYGLA